MVPSQELLLCVATTGNGATRMVSREGGREGGRREGMG